MENSSFLLNLTPSYSTSGPTAPTEDETLELSLVIILCTVLGVASILGTLGNALVLLSIIKFDNLRAIPDLFIFSLSLSDILVTAIYQPLKAYRLAHFSTTNTELILLISHFQGHFSLIASITNVFGVTVERLISIRFPMKYDLFVTRRRAIITVICIWIFSVTYGALACVELLPRVFVSIYFMLVLIGTVSIYIYIFFIAKRLEDFTVNQYIPNGSSDDERPNRERKAAKTIVIILGVALGCWLPFIVLAAIFSTRFLKIFYSLQVLSVCNSSINPYIYCVRSRRYFVAFVNLLGLQRIFKRQATVSPAHSRRNPALNANDAPVEIQSLEIPAR
ncbi:Melanocortin receptor 4 [Desmophyllum pertusum]|uniref:Melanocortin receptor 4 n=1 Tax=Desmophyllum pertusum TaxID=174260 RepID=A0A9W9YFX2_9CNID|nr:Melanocortin receptor 4 [Desmophyllum pertusum]